MELDPGRQYTLRFWLGAGDTWDAMNSSVPTVQTAMPLAASPYYVEASLIPVPGLAAGLTESCEVNFYASAPVLVVTHVADGDTQLLGALTPVTRHD